MLSRIAVIITLISVCNRLSSHSSTNKSLLDNEITIYREKLKTVVGSNMEPFVLMGLGILLNAQYKPSVGLESIQIFEESLTSFNKAMKLGISDENIRITLNKERLNFLWALEEEGYFMGDEYHHAFNDTSSYNINDNQSLYALIFKASYLLYRGKFFSSTKLLLNSMTGIPDDLILYSQLVRLYEMKLVDISYDSWYNIHLNFQSLILSIENKNIISNQLEVLNTVGNDNNVNNMDKKLLPIPISYFAYLQYAKTAYYIGDYATCWETIEKTHQLVITPPTATSLTTDKILNDYQNIKNDFNFIKVLSAKILPHILKNKNIKKLNQDNITPVFIIGFQDSDLHILNKLIDIIPSIHRIRHASILEYSLQEFTIQLATIMRNVKTTQELYNFCQEYGNNILSTMKAVTRKEKQYLHPLPKKNKKNKKINKNSLNGITHIIDYPLSQFGNIGFIHLLFPHAIVINIVRDPIGSLLATLMQTNTEEADKYRWIHDQELLVLKLRLHLEGLSYWRKTLPPILLDVQYEQLILNPESTILNISRIIGVSDSKEVTHNSLVQFNITPYTQGIKMLTNFTNTAKRLTMLWQKEVQILHKNNDLVMYDEVNWMAEKDFDYFQSRNYVKVCLIIPVTSKGVAGAKASGEGAEIDIHQLNELPIIKYLLPSINATLDEETFLWTQITIIIGFDENDPIYDNDNNMHQIITTIKSKLPLIDIKTVKLTGLTNKVVHIWNTLIGYSYRIGAEYFFCLGDDVVMLSKNWIGHIILRLRHNKFLTNLGTVAFFDEHKIEVHGTRPTFPVFHRTHLKIFGVDSAFNPIFENQFADPWLYDVYQPFNSSAIEKNAHLYNVIGGDFIPRYDPQLPDWEAYIDAVQSGRRRVAMWIALRSSVVNYTWSPSRLVYDSEGLHYSDYCNQSPGCLLN